MIGVVKHFVGHNLLKMSHGKQHLVLTTGYKIRAAENWTCFSLAAEWIFAAKNRLSSVSTVDGAWIPFHTWQPVRTDIKVKFMGRSISSSTQDSLSHESRQKR